MFNYRITDIFGIPIRINISLVIFLPILAWLLARPEQIVLYAGLIEALSGRVIDTGPLVDGSVPVAIGIVTAVALFVSVLLHELGHSWMARRYDIPIVSITLWIFGGVASMERLPKEWDREFWIAIAGPAVSIGLGILALGVAVVLPADLPVTLFVVGWIGTINIVLAVFNLLPAFPMDGGRIFRALLARNRPYVEATRTAARLGRTLAFGLAILGVLGFNVIMLLVALFVYTAASSESRMVALDDLLDGVTAGDLMTREFSTVEEDASIASLIERMTRERQTGYPVVDADGSVVGMVGLADLQSIATEDRETTAVGAVMNRHVGTIEASLPAVEVLRELSRPDVDRLLIRTDGVHVGIVSEEDVGRALTVLQAVGTDHRPPEWTGGVS